MRRKNAEQVEVKNPGKGLLTRVPPDLDSQTAGQYITIAQNVRAQQGALESAPGYERLATTPSGLDSPVNMIFQADLTATDREIKKAALFGTESKVYVVTRRSRPLVCGSPCRVQFAFVADTGQVRQDAQDVADLVRSWGPAWVQHGGDMLYRFGPVNPDLDVTKDIWEECLFRYYYYWVGGYRGTYGIGPTENNFFPALSNHDWTDGGGIERFYELFTLPTPERYYTYRRGPVQVFVLSTYGQATGGAVGSGEGADVTETGACGQWFAAVAAASDATFKIVVDPFPSYSSFAYVDPGRVISQQWSLFSALGIDVVLTGDAHMYERCLKDGVYYITAGTGGAVPVTSGPPIPESQVIHTGIFGALRITADYNNMLIEFRDVADQLWDSITIPAKVPGSVCYIGDLAKQPVEVIVVPQDATVEVGQSWQFRAYLINQDGTSQDITDFAVWEVQSPGIGRSSDKGLITGVAEGTTNVTASYSGLSDTSQLHVIADCTRTPVEWILAFELSDTMNAVSGYVTRLDRLKHAANMFIDSIDPERDKIGIVTFSGTYATQSENAAVVQPLTNDFQAVKDAVAAFTAGGAVGTADGVEKAIDEFTGPNHDPHIKERMLVLFVDNPANVTAPTGTTSSLAAARTEAMAVLSNTIADLTEEGICCTIVGLDVEAPYADQYAALATPGYWFPAAKAELDLDTIYGGLANLICNFGCEYFFAQNNFCGPGANPSLNYNSFINWTVEGRVDLIGQCSGGESLFDLVPGNGLYVDMAGSAGYGLLKSKVTYPFVSGSAYKLDINVAGNQRQDYNMSLVISVQKADGTIEFQATVTPPNYLSTFDTYTFNFTADSTFDGYVEVKQIAPPDDAVDAAGDAMWDAVGLLVDVIVLTNVTTSSILLTDNFDGEF